MTRTEAAFAGGFIVACVCVGSALVAIALGAAAVIRHIIRRRDSRHIEALIVATSEQHPMFTDWDTRELTDDHR